MKKILSIAIASVMLFSNSALAIDYGSEWSGHTATSSTSFKDVPDGHWAKDNIDRVVAKGWFNGYEDGTFHPNDSITRAEAMTVFVKFLGLQLKTVENSSYYDVKITDWYCPYIERGKLLFPKITTYDGQTPFQPNMPITREDTVYALVTALRYTDDTLFADQSALNMFKDKNSISELIKPYMVVAVQKGLVSGYDDGTIGAQDPLTRAEFATLLYRATYIGFGTSVLNLDDDTPTVSSIELAPISPYQMHIGESVQITAHALMSTGTREDYSANLYPVTTDSCIAVDGNTIKAVSAGTGTVKFLNDANLANSTITIVVSNPTGSPVFGTITAPDTVTTSTATITGSVSDPSGAALTLDMDGESVNLSGNSFSKTVNLEVGTNTYVFTVKNIYGATAVKTVRIKRENEAAPVRTAEPTAAPADTATTAPRSNRSDDDDKYLTSMEWSVSSLDMSAGESASIKLYGIYSDGSREDITGNYGFSSTDESVATINSRGKITAVSGGTTRITFNMASSASVSMPAPLKVTVRGGNSTSSGDAVLTGLEWSTSSVTVSAGENATFKLYGIYSDGSKADLTTECGVYALDDDIASVSGTKIKGISKGTTQLWFSSIPSTNISLPGMLDVKVVE
ncbi:MAG: S-layer homology domain-containing protein [Clostridia bacterium]|nr:S-layer homology domain-containing protein [Clostridia bacterium]